MYLADPYTHAEAITFSSKCMFILCVRRKSRVSMYELASSCIHCTSPFSTVCCMHKLKKRQMFGSKWKIILFFSGTVSIEYEFIWNKNRVCPKVFDTSWGHHTHTLIHIDFHVAFENCVKFKTLIGVTAFIPRFHSNDCQHGVSIFHEHISNKNTNRKWRKDMNFNRKKPTNTQRSHWISYIECHQPFAGLNNRN